MIRGMVDRLATRLKQDGSDVEGWLRLVRAYMVMGDRDKAVSALAEARQAVARRCRALAAAQRRPEETRARWMSRDAGRRTANDRGRSMTRKQRRLTMIGGSLGGARGCGRRWC